MNRKVAYVGQPIVFPVVELIGSASFIGVVGRERLAVPGAAVGLEYLGIGMRGGDSRSAADSPGGVEEGGEIEERGGVGERAAVESGSGEGDNSHSVG